MISRMKKILLGSMLFFISFTNQNCYRESTNRTKDFDIVILNGRVIDPESNLDAISNIGIGKGTVQLITTKDIRFY
jgi:hypothetical protein